MAKDNRHVEFGYDPKIAKDASKGTILVLDAFVDYEEAELTKVVQFAEIRSFAQVVLFLHHEKTLKSMGLADVPAFHKRLKVVDALVDALPPTVVRVSVDIWEAKRKKYTPLELLLRYFEEKYRPPYFLYVTDGYANEMAQFASFDECLKKVRLLIDPKYRVPAHPKLTQVEHRWEYVE